MNIEFCLVALQFSFHSCLGERVKTKIVNVFLKVLDERQSRCQHNNIYYSQVVVRHKMLLPQWMDFLDYSSPLENLVVIL